MLPFQVPDYIRSLVPYVPGKPIEETQREYKIKRVIKLASNENPLGPSPKAIAAVMKILSETHRYPDGAAFKLKQALSKHLGVARECLLVGNGSNEIIDFLIRTYCVAGDAIVTSQAAFIAYKICAQIHGVRALEAPMDSELRSDLGAILKLVQADPRAKLVMIANPNNPTGTYVNSDALRSFLRELAKVRGGSVLAVLDYAYWEYVTAKDLPDPLALMREFPQVVVLRTFSKIHGLAGFRAGYAVGDPQVIRDLEKVRQPFNLNSLALAAAEAALSDEAFVKRARKLNTDGLKFWESKLRELGIPFWGSQGNFLLVDVRKGLGKLGAEVYEACLRKGVIFRPVTNYGLPHALRISVGTPEENRLAAAVLAELAGRPARPTAQNTVSRKTVRKSKKKKR